ncbi:ATP-binding protein [Natronococcus pandeyae]|nr:ATP-binding protein [Natronococcus pandeyae]
MATDDPETLVRRFIEEVLVDENHEAIDDLFVKSFDEPVPTIDGNLAEGVDELKASYEEFHAHISIRDVEIVSILASAEEAMALWEGVTEYLAPYRGIQPSGKPKRHQTLIRVEVDDGRIAAVREVRDTLATIPPAARVAHTSALAMLETGVVAVDNQGDIVHVNTAALEAVGRDREDIIGTPVADVYGDAVAILYPGETTEVTLDDGQAVFEVTASPLRDERYGVNVGRFLLFHDITERQRRIQQLQVLNRVLRHNIRNELNAVITHAEHACERIEGNPELVDRCLDTIVETSYRLADLSETARQIQMTLEPEHRTITEQDLASLGRRLVSRAREEYPDVTVEYEGPEVLDIEATTSLQAGLWELVENACVHNDAAEPTVTVVVDRRGDRATVTVADNGPGIPEHERIVIEAGEESPLEHGQGLGLWLAHWAVEVSSGTLSFEANEPRGSVVTVEMTAAEDRRATE